MFESLFEATPAVVISLILFVGMLLMTFLGQYVAVVRAKRRKDLAEDHTIGTMEGSLLGLCALFLAFTFNMSGTRYDERRLVIVEEANAIGTAILRADLYPDSIRQEFRKDFKQYVELRIAYYNTRLGGEEFIKVLNESNEVSARIWKRATAYSGDPKLLVASLEMIPALNSMIDLVTSRYFASASKVPQAVFDLLCVLCLVASFVVGYGSNRLDWVIAAGFSLMMTLAIYMIVDLDRPRRGLINMDLSHEQIVNLLNMFVE